MSQFSIDDVREHAAGIVLDRARQIEFMSISDRTETWAEVHGLTAQEHTELCSAIDEAISAATITIDWPEGS